MLFYVCIFPPLISLLVQALSLTKWTALLVNFVLVLLVAYACKQKDTAITTWLLNTPMVQRLLLELVLCEWQCLAIVGCASW